MLGGGDGVISVTANVAPGEMSKLAKACREGNRQAAKDLNSKVSAATMHCFRQTPPDRRLTCVPHIPPPPPWYASPLSPSQVVELHSKLFLQGNPVTVKYALARLGRICDVLRVPLMPMEEEFKGLVDQALDSAGLLSLSQL